MAEGTSQEKSSGIIIVAIYTAISGMVGVLSGLSQTMAPENALYVLAGLFLLTFSMLHLVAAYKLWTLEAWGLQLTKYIYYLGIPLSILDILFISESPRSKFSGLISIFLSVWIITYLHKPEVKSLYNQA